MKSYIKKSITQIPIEDVHGGSVSRQVLVKQEEINTHCLEAFNKGYIKPGDKLDWGKHKDIDEITIVIKGQGRYYCEDEETTYKRGDVFIVHANKRHKIEADGNETSEFYWLRLKTK